MTDIREVLRSAIGACPSLDENGYFCTKSDAITAVLEAISASEGGREPVALWMMGHGYATGHGDALSDLLTELELQAVERGKKQVALTPVDHWEFFDWPAIQREAELRT